MSNLSIMIPVLKRPRARRMSLRTLHDAGEMQELIDCEYSRAVRIGAVCSLVLFSSEIATSTRISIYRLARVLQQRARRTDQVGWFDENRLCVMLPDTGPVGAKKFAEDVCGIAASQVPNLRFEIYSHSGKGDDASPRLERHSDGARGDDVSLQAKTSDTSPASVDESLETLLTHPLPWWKRVMDIVTAFIGLMVLSPLMVVVACMIRLTSKGPALFKQRRAGLGGKPFTMFKFRTMVCDAEALKQALMKLNEQDGPAFKLTNDPRITRIGQFLRKTSIDELPQLWNVLRGEMSLVGPRPLPINESDQCNPWQRRRLYVTPGLTCIWQIEGRGGVTFDEWSRMDIRYSRERTIQHDLRILVRTALAVVLRKGAR